MFESIYNICSTIGTNVLYLLIYGYTWLMTFFETDNKKYILNKVQLHLTYLNYSIYDKCNKSFPKFKYMKLFYTYNNHPYKLIINSSNISDLNKYYPPYEISYLENVDTNMKPILSATVTTKEPNAVDPTDVTDLVNEYAGPNQDFYKSLQNYTPPKVSDIWGATVVNLYMMTNNVEEINIEPNDLVSIPF